MNILAEKSRLRSTIVGISRSLLQPLRESQSRVINSLVLESSEWKTSRTVALFLPINGEPDITPLVQAAWVQGKRILLPRVTGPKAEDMTMLYLEDINELDLFPSSKYGVREPPLEVLFGPRKGSKRMEWNEKIESESANDSNATRNENKNEIGSIQNIDLLVVPGVAFDFGCNRLGHGKGYYDSFIVRNQSQQALDTSGSGGKKTFLLGIALNEQLVEKVPHDDRDMRLDAIVCECKGIIRRT
jgi:5-formyltetrahydrofolate cyclo-ligase